MNLHEAMPDLPLPHPIPPPGGAPGEVLRITAAHWIDYVHLGRVDGRWVIINILWEPTE